MKKLAFLIVLIPFWISCGNGLSDKDEQMYKAQGQVIANTTFVALATRLQQAIADSGVIHAVRYCNLAAYPITDSMSRYHRALIRRTSPKFRNAANAPTAREREVLAAYLGIHLAGTPVAPMVKAAGPDSVDFFAPILTQALCLNCHGIPGKTLLPEVNMKIKALYPEDLATGFSEGDLRGMWSIRMPRE
jgi:hypothetical protein